MREQFDEEQVGAGEELGELDLQKYVGIVWRRRWPIIAIVAVGVTLAVVHTKRQIPVYRATATVLLDPSPPQVLDRNVQEVVQLGAASYWSTAEYYNGQLAILRSGALAEQAARDHRLYELLPEAANPALSLERRVELAGAVLAGGLSVGRDEDEPVVQISMSHTDPQVAASFANAYVASYIKYSLGLRTDATDQAKSWLSVELDTAAADLRTSELELFEFKKQHDILSVSLEDRRNLVGTNIARYDDAANEARVKRLELETLLDNIRAARELGVLESPIFELTDNEVGRDLRRVYNEELRKLAALEQSLGPKNPEYREQQQTVAAVVAAMEREAASLAEATEARYRAALSLEQKYREQLAAYKEQAFALGPLEVDYNRLARGEKSDEERFSLLQGRLQASDLTSRLQTVNVRPLDAAVVPGAPISRMRRNVLMAAALSLLLGIALAFALEQLNRTVKSPDELEQVARAPMLGLIPAVVGTEPHLRDRHVFEDPMSPASECCRAIRTNLLFASADRELKTMAITSPNPHEGKTTAIMYLATAMAQSGLRVLVVDSDMRRPRIHKTIGVHATLGLSGLILGETSIEDAVKTTDVPNLYVLPSGSPPPNPSELLMTKRFEAVLGELGARYDRILLDTPPLLAVTDGAILARHADAVLLVVKSGDTRKTDVARAERVLADVRANVAGVVLNAVDLSDRRYHYHYYYGYGRARGDVVAAEANRVG